MYDKWVDTISSHIIFNLEKNECINETILIFFVIFYHRDALMNEIYFNFLMLYEWMHDHISLVFFFLKKKITIFNAYEKMRSNFFMYNVFFFQILKRL